MVNDRQIFIYPTSCRCGGKFAYFLSRDGIQESIGCICHNDLTEYGVDSFNKDFLSAFVSSIYHSADVKFIRVDREKLILLTFSSPNLLAFIVGANLKDVPDGYIGAMRKLFSGKFISYRVSSDGVYSIEANLSAFK